MTICAVSGSRADYGLLQAPLRAIRDDRDFRLKLVLTGQHLSAAAGDAAARARADGFEIAAAIDIMTDRDDAVAATKAASRALDGLGDAMASLAPDLMLLLGDRYEILACAMAATIAQVPVAHIAGGDVTEGAFDDSFRHAITKMSHLHFVTNADAARRVRQLGEAPGRIHVVGNPALDLIATTPLPARADFFASIGLPPRRRNLLVTFHPVTLASDSLGQLEELLGALDQIEDAAILVTGSNADPEGRRIETRVRGFVAQRPAARFVGSLGTPAYFAALSHMDAVVGNSSSGLYEAPSFGIPTVDIGERQRGRLRAQSVFSCPPRRDAIASAIGAALARGRKPTVNPYGDGHAAEKILAVLKTIEDPRALLAKRFVDIEAA